MSQPNQLPTAIRNIRARLRPFKRPLAWGSLGFVFLLTLFVWEYWHEREPIDFEALFPNEDSLLSADARERAAEIDSSWAIEENLKQVKADSPEAIPENLKQVKADSPEAIPENLQEDLPQRTTRATTPNLSKPIDPNTPAEKASSNSTLTPDISPKIDSFSLKIPEVKASSRELPATAKLPNPINVGSTSAKNSTQGNIYKSGIAANGAIAAPKFGARDPFLVPWQHKQTQLSPLQAAIQQYPPLAITRNYRNPLVLAPGLGNYGNPSNYGNPTAIAPGLGNYGNPGNPGNYGNPTAIAPGLGNYGHSGNSAYGYGYQGDPAITAIAQPNPQLNAKRSQAFPTGTGQSPYDILYHNPNRLASTRASGGGSSRQYGYSYSLNNSAKEPAPGEFLYSPLPEQSLFGSANPRGISLQAAPNARAYSPSKAADTTNTEGRSNSYKYLLQSGAIGNNPPPITNVAVPGTTEVPEALLPQTTPANFGAVNPAVPNQSLVNQTRPTAIPQTQPLIQPTAPTAIPQTQPLVKPIEQNRLTTTEFTPEFQNPQLQPTQPRAPFTVPRPIPGRYIGGGEINTFSNP